MAGEKKQMKFALYDSLTLIAKFEDGWSKWESRTGSLYVFRHLHHSEKKSAPVAQCYKDRKYFSGVFRTTKPSEFSGDILDKDSKRRVFILFNFEGADKVKIFRRV